DNGEIAVAMVAQAPYDLVFMDMQMPVMDGVSATRAIRAQPRFEHLPIVAMTANAMEQDRNRCLDAGMNDFLVKPIDPQAMRSMLLRWVRPRAAQPAAPTPASASAPAPVAVPAPASVPAQPRPPATPGDALPAVPGLNTTLGLSRMVGKKPLYM